MKEMPIGKTGTDISESYVAMIAGLGVAEVNSYNRRGSDQTC